jgi:hypothetical protein
LRQSLTIEHNISSSIIDQYLKIYQGDVKNLADVARVLVNPNDESLLVDVILSGVGSYPTFQWSIMRPFPLRDPTICQTAVEVIYAAISNLSSAQERPITNTSTGGKPLLVVISTAGCGRRRGIPLSIYLPYHYLLGSPLADKIEMEKVVITGKGKYVRDFVVMRPPFLTNGEARGEGSLRVGWEWGLDGGDGSVKEPGPQIGYTVSRKDIGSWVFEKVIVQGAWDGKCIYLTY